MGEGSSEHHSEGGHDVMKEDIKKMICKKGMQSMSWGLQGGQPSWKGTGVRAEMEMR